MKFAKIISNYRNIPTPEVITVQLKLKGTNAFTNSISSSQFENDTNIFCFNPISENKWLYY